MQQRLDERRWELLRTASLITIAVLATITALYFSSELLVPIAFAFLFNGMLRPVMRWFEVIRVPATTAAAVVVLALVTTLAGIGYGLSWPIESWMRDVP